MLPKSSLILPSALLLAIPLVCRALDSYADVLDQFRRYGPQEFGEVLDRRRPPLVAPELAARIVAALPTQGEVERRTVSDLDKLGSISAVLRAHGREGVYLTKVVDSVQARVGLHARFILLATNTALRVLSPAQFQAIVAHEIGHEYVWDEYEAAQRQGSWRQLRALELFCDGVAMVTLARIGADPATLTDALRLMAATDKLNRLLSDDSSHPTLVERAEFARQIGKWLDAGRGSTSEPRAPSAPHQKTRRY